MRINDTIMKSYYTLFDEGLSSERFWSALQATEHTNYFTHQGNSASAGMVCGELLENIHWACGTVQWGKQTYWIQTKLMPKFRGRSRLECLLCGALNSCPSANRCCWSVTDTRFCDQGCCFLKGAQMLDCHLILVPNSLWFLWRCQPTPVSHSIGRRNLLPLWLPFYACLQWGFRAGSERRVLLPKKPSHKYFSPSSTVDFVFPWDLPSKYWPVLDPA